MMFRSHSNISKYFLRDYVTIAMVIILVAMATPISSHVKDTKKTTPDIEVCPESLGAILGHKYIERGLLKTTLINNRSQLERFHLSVEK